jgi:hypothetical protein
MRLKCLAFALALAGAADAAHAATIIIYTNPMTLDRHAVVYETPGPDRAFMCMAPPGDSGCVPLRLKRGQPVIYEG